MNEPTKSLPFSGEELKTAARQLLYRRDFDEFFRRELKIATKEMGLQPFYPNPAQIILVRAAQDQLQRMGKIRQVVFKCRQAGISTYASGVVWNRASMFTGVYAFIIAHDKDTAGHIFGMHDIFYRNMSSEMRPFRQYFTKDTELVLGNSDAEDPSDLGINSKLFVGEAKNINVGTGRTIHCLHSTETCRYPSSDSVKESLIPACSDAPGTVRIWESTAHFGKGADYFRDQCERAMHRKSEYEFHFVKWWLQPEYSIKLQKGEKLRLDADERYLVKKVGMSLDNIKWRRQKINDLEGDIDSFHLSYPTTYEEGWILKEQSAFPRARLLELYSMVKPPLRRFEIDPHGNVYPDPEGRLWVWHMPEKGKKYFVGGDVGGGHEDGDFSVAETIEQSTNIQCAEWRGHILPSDFAQVLAAIGKMYNTAQIACEVNNHGMVTNLRLRDLYSNLYQWRKQDTIAPKFTGLIGWETQYKSKLVLVGHAHTLIYHRQVQIFSKILWDEMRNFARDYTESGMTTYAAATGYDDCCMAWMIALKCSDDEDFSKFRGDVHEKVVEKNPDPCFHDTQGLFQPESSPLLVDTGAWK